MSKKHILLIEDDDQTAAAIKEALSGYEIAVIGKAEEAAKALRSKTPELIILDIDQKEQEGLQLFRSVHQLAPRVNIVIVAGGHDIPLAVKATKLGAVDFIKKPFTAAQFKSSIDRLAAGESGSFFLPSRDAWLQGMSDKIKFMYSEIQEAVNSNRNLIIFGETGIEKDGLVEYLHRNSLRNKRRLVKIDLDAFRRENMEANFWATVQELMAEPKVAAARSEEDLCGTLYLQNLESVEANFKTSLFEFFRERKGNIDKEVLVVVGLSDRKSEQVKGYAWVEIPPLRERREDLPRLINYYTDLYSRKHNKKVKAVSTGLLDFMMIYQFPGNYVELQLLIEQAVLLSTNEVMDFDNLPLGVDQVLQISADGAYLSGQSTLPEADREFEKNLYKILLAKTKGDVASMARYLDIPRTTLAERIEELGLALKQEVNPGGN